MGRQTSHLYEYFSLLFRRSYYHRTMFIFHPPVQPLFVYLPESVTTFGQKHVRVLYTPNFFFFFVLFISPRYFRGLSLRSSKDSYLSETRNGRNSDPVVRTTSDLVPTVGCDLVPLPPEYSWRIIIKSIQTIRSLGKQLS